jgi:hypothetical protein
MVDDPFEFDRLSLTPEQIAELAPLQKKPPKQSRTASTEPEFVKFPYEQILRAGGRLGNAQLAILVELTHLRFKTHRDQVELDNKALEAVGISRWAKYDALVGLEDAGLVRVKHRYKKSPLVTILWD